MKVEGIEVSRTINSEGDDSVLVTWDVNVPGVYKGVKGFNIYRSLSSEDNDFEKINFLLINSGVDYYLDTTADMRIGVNYYYKILVVDGEDTESSLAEADLKYIWGEKEKRADMFASLSWVAVGRAIQNLDMMGQDGVIFLRIRYGDRCSQCWDSIGGYSTKRNCPVCWGTGYAEGYVRIPKKIIFTKGGMRYLETESGFKEGRGITAHIDNFPIIHPGDMISNQANDRFLVSNVTPTRIRNTLISQEMELNFLNRDNPLYDVVGKNE